MMKALRSDEDYLGMAWLATAFNVGARRSEIIQFKTSLFIMSGMKKETS